MTTNEAIQKMILAAANGQPCPLYVAQTVRAAIEDQGYALGMIRQLWDDESTTFNPAQRGERMAHMAEIARGVDCYRCGQNETHHQSGTCTECQDLLSA